MKDTISQNEIYQPNFNKVPVLRVSEFNDGYLRGWENIFRAISGRMKIDPGQKTVITVDCNLGIYYDELLRVFSQKLNPDLVITSNDYFMSPDEIQRITWPDVTDDRIFGYLTRLNFSDLTDKNKAGLCRDKIRDITDGVVLVFGYGASLIAEMPTVLVYADMPRWETELRMRAGTVENLGLRNSQELAETKYKRAFFVDWRVCDRHKKKLMARWDFILDTTLMNDPGMITASAFSRSLRKALTTPFSIVPTFDHGIWGGQWMKKMLGIDPEPENYSWCFNCIPEEQSLMLDFGEGHFEMPSVNLVFAYPAELLGEAVYGRFGDEFPIRFDYLDTMDGGNLSLQVHPVTEYIQEKFGVHYTQDESYYIMDTGENPSVYLGLKEGINPREMIDDLNKAQDDAVVFDDVKYINRWPAKKHDHFLIPGGTIHASGKNCLVLEISATTYIFTFKLWDWGRLDIDGRPRPINIDHGRNVIQWNRTTDWVRQNLINRVTKISEGDGWTEEFTGLHEREFIETRRHWFSKKVNHNTHGGVNVLNLVEGREIIVESPDDSFEPFIIHYAETFIVPASVGTYTIRPYGESEGKLCATIKAYVRT
ncbi:MAG: mannose-6-phosphate isomerase [Bacteroidales bacterium]|nr:mannose-6-phosphate isomerase [Bacteroidales bacterium]